MSAIDVFFLCSVPGSHEHARYGQAAVEDLLKSHADPVIRDWPVTVQCSSIGSLGKAICRIWQQKMLMYAFVGKCYEGSFLEELATSLNAAGGTSGKKPPAYKVKFVYPTVENVIQSHGGPAYGCG